MPNLSARTLGRFLLTDSSRPVDIPGLRDKALAAFLSVNRGRFFRREFLADLLWQSTSDAKAKHSLSQSLYAIRRRIPDLVEVQDAMIGCEIKTDIDRFRELVSNGDLIAAASLIQGPFLDGLVVDAAPQFEDWRDSFGRRLYKQLEEQLIATFRSLSPVARRQTIGVIPITVLQLMPEFETVVVNGTAYAQAESVASSKPDEQPRGPSELSADQLPFVGRHSQLRQVHASWLKCIAGEAQFLIVTGDAGFGKTRLLDETIARVVSDDVPLIQTSCYEPERTVPFGPMIDALAQCAGADLTVGLDPVWSNALSELAPATRGGATVLPTLSPSASRSRLFEAFLRLFENACKLKPIVFRIDDLQWCDESTRALLSFLSRRVHHIPLLVMGALRLPRGSSLRQPWARWIRIGVDELTAEELEDLVGQLALTTPSVPTVNKLTRLTAGHPYLLTQFLRAGHVETLPRGKAVDIPKSIEGFVNSMLEDLPVSSQRIVAIMAVLGRPAPLGLIRRIAKKNNVASALAELMKRGIIEVGQQQIRFRHDLVREAAYAQLPLLTRVEIHRQTATVLQHRRQWAGQTAVHYYRARLRKLAFKYALMAVKDADRRAAVYESVKYLELARRARPERDALLRPLLAERMSRVHRHARARTILEPILAANVLAPGKVCRLRLLDLEMAFALGVDGDKLRDDIAILERQLGHEDQALAHRAVRLRLRSGLKDGRKDLIAGAIHELRELSRMAWPTPTGVESLATAVKAHCLTRSSSEAEAWAYELVQVCDDISDSELRINVLGVLGYLAYESGRLRKSEALHNRALAEIEQVGAITVWPVIASHHHMLLLELGNFESATKLAKEIGRRTSEMDALQTRAILAANNGSMLYDCGEYTEAKRVVNEVLQGVAGFNWVWIKLVLNGILGLVAIEEGQLDRAIELAEFGQRELDRMGLRMFDLSPMEILIARVEVLRQRRADAIARLEGAISDYTDRDLVCRLKMTLELARVRRSGDKHRARQEATDVFRIATEIGARPLAERADSLLHRT